MGADEPDAGPDPVERLLDLCVFAPLGFVTDAARLVPELAERGRQQATMARMVGEFAVTWGNAKVQEAVGQAQEQVVDVLQRFGVASPEPGPAPGAPREEPPPPDDGAADAQVSTEAPSEARVAPVDTTFVGTASVDVADGPEMIEIVDDVWLVEDEASAAGAPMVGPADATTLAIPDYDNLSASQVVPRLDGLTPAELDAVLGYERGHRHRKTILNRIAQLQDGLG